MATVEIAEYQDDITVEVNETYEVITVVVETPTEGGTEETAASIKLKYESNADTNAFTDAEKTKVANALTELPAHNHDTDYYKKTEVDTALEGKVDDSQVLTNVPENAVFTDTVYDDTQLQADVKKKTISYALSSPSADLTTGDTDSFHAPYDFTLVTYFAGVVTAPTGSALVVGLKKNGTSVTSSDAIIDSGETTSLTGTAPVLTTTSFLKGDVITPVISQVGSLETGKSLKIYLEINKS